ncbi:hypothetical protein BST23_00080 [Mycolicibacterium elephantis]|uniref:DUF732 domain-containing protein n=1 Tax=Mycolicibacterium elephantis TaxID=81858 RepID=A0A1X0D9S2_9MYCO|nr:hypothetical protein [Mycolicibacterium elephantis]ORA69107.1 hypothetical protein BST23_00080 [Mycolicibacterium elephantis]
MVLAGSGSALAAASAFAMLCTAPFASADALTGKTYAEASQKIAQWNSEPEIVTVTGTRLPIDECIVTSWVKSSRVDASHELPHADRRNGWPNQRRRHAVHLLHLDCNAELAQPGAPGGSVMTRRGREEAFLQDREEYFRANPDRTEELQAFCSRHPERSVCPSG